eukprot:gnl/TRDRNA2_/TRDRNA2_169528_c3_seq4.p1 gnl/TRDRNA2_/TRDRNA2_169528_c3~~gnl/TRDRNA2_/TRDRNA2_169528_c3_seq4.p1  ORF type:complete len:570 (-),score=93.36 gnl/TRDRNA2_/TRDRNA2_169528_c3_seq4:248-1957(-)
MCEQMTWNFPPTAPPSMPPSLALPPVLSPSVGPPPPTMPCIAAFAPAPRSFHGGISGTDVAEPGPRATIAGSSWQRDAQPFGSWDFGLVSLDISDGSATITLRESVEAPGVSSLHSETVAILQRCFKAWENHPAKIRMIFFCVGRNGTVGTQPELRQPWHGIGDFWEPPPAESVMAPPGLGASSSCSIDGVCDIMLKLPQVVVGMVRGKTCAEVTSLLACCDSIIATYDTQFEVVKQSTQGCCAAVPLALLKRVDLSIVQELLQSEQGTLLDFHRAKMFGFNVHVVPDGITGLLREQAYLHREFAHLQPTFLSSVKALLHRPVADRMSMLAAPPPPPPAAPPMKCIVPSVMPSERTFGFVPQSIMTCPQAERWTEAPLKFLSLSSQSTAPPFVEDSLDAEPMLEASLQEALDAEDDDDSGAQGDTSDFDSQNEVHAAKNKDPPTTLMICNIPCRITQQQLSQAVATSGFGEKWDFLYLPTIGRSTSSGTKNLGYGFVNFPSPNDAAVFMEVFDGYRFHGTYSAKVVSVRVAHIQGLDDNIRHFGSAGAKLRQRGPLVQQVKDPASPISS